MKKMLLILNPCAGKRKASKRLSEILAIFNRAGYTVTVHVTAGPGDASKVIGQLGHQMDIVVCCGGDGTFNETINGLLRHDLQIPIGYIPCGSTNDFAASLKLPTDILDAARAIAEGTPLPYDVGLANGRFFSYVASFGAFTRSSYATNQKLKNSLGFFAYLCSGVTDLFRIRSIPVQLEADGQAVEGAFLFGSISNSTRVGGIMKLDPHRVDMADGQLELMLIHKPKHVFQLLPCVWKLRKQRYDSPLVTFLSAKQLRVTCPTGTVWTLDGERYDAPETLEISNEYHAIRLVQKG